jgi:hypothetical protein
LRQTVSRFWELLQDLVALDVFPMLGCPRLRLTTRSCG